MLKRFAVTLALLFIAPSAHADTAVAEALFDDGRRLFDAGQYEQACPKFAESQRLDPGTGTLLNLANCYEKAGKLATAWATWREAASSARAAGQSDREEHARKNATRLEGQVARLTITVDSQALVEGLVVTQNGVAQNSAIFGTALPVDAGTYKIEAKAPGYLDFAQEITLANGESKTAAIPPMVVGDSAAPEPEPENQYAEDEPVAKQEPAEPKDGGTGASPLKPIGFAALGLGVVGVGVGSYFGVRAINKNKDSEAGCESNGCNSSGLEDREAARSAGTTSTVLIGVGAALAATGVVLLIVAPSQNTALSASPTYGGGTLHLKGSF